MAGQMPAQREATRGCGLWPYLLTIGRMSRVLPLVQLEELEIFDRSSLRRSAQTVRRVPSSSCGVRLDDMVQPIINAWP